MTCFTACRYKDEIETDIRRQFKSIVERPFEQPIFSNGLKEILFVYYNVNV